MASMLEQMMEEPEELPEDVQEPEAPEVEAASDEVQIVSEAEKEAEKPEKKPAAVPSWRLREETQKRRALEEQIQKMEARFQALQQRLETPQEAPKPPPAYEEDPGAHLMHRLNDHEQTLKAVREREAAQQQQMQEMQVIQTWAQRFTQEEQSFAQERAPDYYDAVSYLRETRMKEYETLGWDPASAKQMIDREAIQIGMDAERRGVSAAERFYQLAKLRGFQGKQPQQDLRRTAENMQRARSLGPSGKPSSRKLTLAEIAQLDDDEFDKLTAGKKWKKLWEQA